MPRPAANWLPSADAPAAGTRVLVDRELYSECGRGDDVFAGGYQVVG